VAAVDGWAPPEIGDLAIREATAADLPRLVELELTAFADPWPVTLLAGELTHHASFLLVAAGGDGGDGGASRPAAGYASFRQAAGEAELLRVAVEPRLRGRGIARQLIAAGLDRLRAGGARRCHLEVRPDNTSALAAYRALGFTAAGRRRAYYRDGTDALVLRREL
jgi:ribosomal-protein-alanine N-acetyltransferase